MIRSSQEYIECLEHILAKLHFEELDETFGPGVLNRRPADQIQPADHSWMALCQL